MARINNAKNFKGKSYVASDEITNIINSIKLNDNKISFAGAMVQDEVNVGLTSSANVIDLNNLTLFLKTIDRVDVIGDTVDEKSLNVPTDYAVKKAIDEAVKVVKSEAIGIGAGNGIDITPTSSTSGTTIQVINAKVANAEKVLSVDNNGLSATISLVKVDTESGYAASYQLQGIGGAILGDTINIVKDQFLKEATLVWGTNATLSNNVVVGESATKTDTATYPFLKMVMYTNNNDKTTDDTLTTTVYIPVDELFRDYTSGNAAI